MAQTHDTTEFNEILQEISESGNPLLTIKRISIPKSGCVRHAEYVRLLKGGKVCIP